MSEREHYGAAVKLVTEWRENPDPLAPDVDLVEAICNLAAAAVQAEREHIHGSWVCPACGYFKANSTEGGGDDDPWEPVRGRGL